MLITCADLHLMDVLQLSRDSNTEQLGYAVSLQNTANDTSVTTAMFLSHS